MPDMALVHRALESGLPSPSPGGPSSSVLPTEYCDLKYAGLYTGPIPDKGPQSIIAIWSLFAAATVFVALRFYCKLWKRKALWWDDFFMAISWVCSVAITHFFHPQLLP